MARATLLLFVALAFSLPTWARPVCARHDTVLRTAPSRHAPVSWRVPKYMPFLRLGSSKGWVKVQDLEGEVHWARPADLSSSLRCVVVKTNTAALHKEPQFSSAGEDLKNLDRYTPLRRLTDQRAWIQVEDEDHHKAWIHESQVWKPVTVNSFSF